MTTDRLQGIIFTNTDRTAHSGGGRSFDKDRFTKKYFRQILGYAMPGGKQRMHAEKRYRVLQTDCDELIAADLFERLHIPVDKIDILR